jgi:hypothetical protein
MNNLVLKSEPNTISFTVGEFIETPFIKLSGNGDIFVKGKLVQNDLELVNALREFLIKSKEMHKQEIENAYRFGLSDEYVIGSQKYYNDTFGKI